MSFADLTPDKILDAVEKATGLRLTTLTSPLPSYINRVYELRTVGGDKFIVKFYRPQRWTREAIADEHCFVADCVEAEVPVIAPLPFLDGKTLAEYNGFLFALYPKKAGRQIEITSDDYWPRLGSLISRMHNAAAKSEAKARIVLHPRNSARHNAEELCARVVPEKFRDAYGAVCRHIFDMSTPLFDKLERIRIHGDCHCGNILDRLEQGLVLIDFDDMAMGPPIQDLWLLLPDRAAKSVREIDLFIQGYEQFRSFDRSGLRAIESLRAMRMIHFLLWCSRQQDDFVFKSNFPAWGTDAFWQREISDLREQAGYVEDAVQY